MKLTSLGLLGLVCFVWIAPPMLGAAELPAIRQERDGHQLMVDGKPFLILGGELGNSSAGTALEADSILPRMAALHLNTVLMPVAWEQIEPEEGRFDFSILDHWIDSARQQKLHLVLLWFGSWKNAFSNYAPAWVKADTQRFPRSISVEGLPLEILSPFGAETLRADSRAFAALMRYVREKDSAQHTVLMVQVENEIGYLGLGGRDRSSMSNRLFDEPVPAALPRGWEMRHTHLSPELEAHFSPHGRTWKEMFGEMADETFMAWQYALFVNTVAEAGKKEYALPMYVNAQLPAPKERAGEYPSGGPYPSLHEVYRVAAPSIDFYSPDIYWPNFDYWIERYQWPGNPIFVPEARLEQAPYNALYTYGEGRGFGFCPFGVDSLPGGNAQASPGPKLSDVYEILENLSDVILQAQARNQTRGLVLHAASARPSQTVSLGGYLFQATLSRSWPARNLLTDDGALMIIEAAPDEFYVVGSGLTVSISRDPGVDTQIAGISAIEQVSRTSGAWVTQRRLNGDQSNQGRQLSMDPHNIAVYRVKLYSYSRTQPR